MLRTFVTIPRFPPLLLLLLAVNIPGLCCGSVLADESSKPNVLFILTDDLGIGDIGVFWQNARRTKNNRAEPWHLTPELDAMAAEGLQLRQHYCPAPVCAPSRASLLLGVHQGHANVRDNQFDKKLEDNHTLATVLKHADYATACIGKWGLQGPPSEKATNGWPGHPMNRGFDDYFGYIGHGAGHQHYPNENGKKLYDKSQEVSADYKGCYTTDLFTARAKRWIGDHHEANPEQPFFLYLAYDTPHAILQLPPGPYPDGGGLKGGAQWLGESGRMINTANGIPDSYYHPDYATAKWNHDRKTSTPEQQWPDVYRRYASAVRRIDSCVGDLIQLLKDLKVDNNTLVVFTSDNGPSKESYLPESYSPDFFNSFGPHDGIKRDLWEGGIRVGALIRWPDSVPAGRISNAPSAFHDWLPTFAELAGIPAPARTDGVSLLPTLQNTGKQAQPLTYIEYAQNSRTPNYREFAKNHRIRKRNQMQAIRMGDFMGVRYDTKSHADPFEIYDVVRDPQQKKNLAKHTDFAPLQQQMKDKVLRVRRPNENAKRPYDNELVPSIEAVNVAPGVQWRCYKQTIAVPWVAKLDDLKPTSSGKDSRPEITAILSEGEQHALFTGYLKVPTDGEYTLSVTTNSGALLRIHEATVIDADFGYQSDSNASGKILLQAGQHPFRLYFARAAAKMPALQFSWSSAEIPLEEIPAGAFSCNREPSQP